MPELTRRRDPDAQQEIWQIHYGDVRVGVIAECVGNPMKGDEGGAVQMR
jgi:hypothetical protein